MLTIVTLLRGSPAYTARWKDFLQRSTLPEGTVLFVAVNNEIDAEIARELGATVFPVEPFAGGSEVERISYVAGIYDMVLSQVTTDRVMLWEDDILPPAGGIEALAAHYIEAAGIVTVTPFRKEQQNIPGVQMALLYYTEDLATIPVASLPKEGIDQVWGGGTAFSVWSTPDIVSTLPWSPGLDARGTPMGWDIDLSKSLKAQDKKIMVDLAIRCYHG